jgi:Fur family ferric uptake transcriptional regulator
VKRGFARFETYLRDNGLKMTRAREQIFREILSAPGIHPNAEEIHRRLRAKVRGGLVTAIDLGESHSHFEPDWNRTSHGHLICLSCGRVQEFRHAEIQAAISRIGEEKGYLLDKFSIQVFGYCQDCTTNRR